MFIYVERTNTCKEFFFKKLQLEALFSYLVNYWVGFFFFFGTKVTRKTEVYKMVKDSLILSATPQINEFIISV